MDLFGWLSGLFGPQGVSVVLLFAGLLAFVYLLIGPTLWRDWREQQNHQPKDTRWGHPWIVGASSKSEVDKGTAVQIPMLGRIVAGQPIPMPEGGSETRDSETLTLTRDILPEQEGVFAIRVTGDSMIDALVKDGDIVVMKKQETADDGDVVAVWLKDAKESTLKRIYRERNRIRLQPMNPTMKPYFVEPRDVQVQGKVILVIRGLQKEPA